MNSTNRLIVKYRDTTVGILALAPDTSACTFQYDTNWLKSGFSISPIELPLKDALFIAKASPFRGNFGIFEDSLPDGYGRYLLHKMLKRQKVDYFSLNPVEMLSIVGNAGMGALTYEPETLIGQPKSLPNIDEIQQMALDTLSEKTSGDEDVLYYNSGNSGGCRPKCLYTDAEGHWIIKFRHTYDPSNMGRQEYLYNEAARKCGINVPDFKLINGKYFATKRFDLDTRGNRLHIATAAALMCESINPPKTDYLNLLHLTGYITQDPMQVKELFRRMAFNVFASNKDDHAKNFSFLYDEQKGKWTLAPAYDITYSPVGYNGEHASSANYNGNPKIEDMVECGKSVRIHRERAIQLIKPIQEICDELIARPEIGQGH